MNPIADASDEGCQRVIPDSAAGRLDQSSGTDQHNCRQVDHLRGEISQG